MANGDYLTLKIDGIEALEYDVLSEVSCFANFSHRVNTALKNLKIELYTDRADAYGGAALIIELLSMNLKTKATHV